MDNIWKYKIDIKDINIFGEISKERGVNFPDDLKQFIVEHNAATPTKYKFMIGSNERVLGAVLSFNKGEEDVDTVFSALNIIEDKNLLPVAIDSFGNYICYALDKAKIVFWEHESGEVFVTEKTLEDFITDLYE